MLCKHFEDFPEHHFQGKKVVEVGSGTGLVGIFVAQLGNDRLPFAFAFSRYLVIVYFHHLIMFLKIVLTAGAKVTLTDQRPALPLLAYNAKANNVECAVRELDWYTSCRSP